jgi:hypothetical protein
LLTLSLLLLVEAGSTLVANVGVVVGELLLAPPTPPTTEVVLEAEVEIEVKVEVVLADLIVLVDVLDTDFEEAPAPVLVLAVIVTVAVAIEVVAVIPATLLALLIAELGMGAPAN